MWKVSNIISSFVVSVFDGQVEGVVNNILFNNKKQAKYLIISRNDEEFFVLDTKDIYKLGNNTVIIKNSTVLNLMDNKEQEIKDCFSPINSIVVNIDGDFLGYVIDINLDEKFNIISVNSQDEKTINLKQILNLSDSAIIVCSNNKIVPKLSRFKQKEKIKIPTKNNENLTVEIMDKNNTILPQRTVANFNFLLNRKVSKNIVNFNGEIIIKENQIINSKVLDIAKINGKIRELTKYSL